MGRLSTAWTIVLAAAPPDAGSAIRSPRYRRARARCNLAAARWPPRSASGTETMLTGAASARYCVRRQVSTLNGIRHQARRARLGDPSVARGSLGEGFPARGPRGEPSVAGGSWGQASPARGPRGEPSVAPYRAGAFIVDMVIRPFVVGWLGRSVASRRADVRRQSRSSAVTTSGGASEGAHQPDLRGSPLPGSQCERGPGPCSQGPFQLVQVLIHRAA